MGIFSRNVHKKSSEPTWLLLASLDTQIQQVREFVASELNGIRTRIAGLEGLVAGLMRWQQSLEDPPSQVISPSKASVTSAHQRIDLLEERMDLMVGKVAAAECIIDLFVNLDSKISERSKKYRLKKDRT